MLAKAIWINLITLAKNTTQIFVEIRTQECYGARWSVDYDFRGLLEPQNEALNARKLRQ